MIPRNLMISMTGLVSRTPWGRMLCTPLFRRMEMLDIVDQTGCVCGAAPRRQVHGNNRLLHRVVHVLVFDSSGGLLLQKRSSRKRVAPGLWDTSVGGHVDFNETVEIAMAREMREELGICPQDPEFVYNYIHANDFESEMVFTYTCIHDGVIRHNPEEIEQVRFWAIEEIRQCMGTGILSTNFEDEFLRYEKHAAGCGKHFR